MHAKIKRDYVTGVPLRTITENELEMYRRHPSMRGSGVPTGLTISESTTPKRTIALNTGKPLKNLKVALRHERGHILYPPTKSLHYEELVKMKADSLYGELLANYYTLTLKPGDPYIVEDIRGLKRNVRINGPKLGMSVTEVLKLFRTLSEAAAREVEYKGKLVS